MRTTNKKEKILVAMSGGVDSSVAAALLVKAGYDVTGAFMVNYSEKDESKISQSCWMGDYRDALRVSAKLGIKLLRLNFVKEYKKMVLDYMYKEYAAGRTPNPDVLCNKFIKFGVWLKKAKELGFDKLATGHYARLGREIRNPPPPEAGSCPLAGKSEIRNKIKLLQAKDKNKDQTYFLHQLSQRQLKHILFPIGDYTKDEVRKVAKKLGLPTAGKEESMGICFIGEVPMKKFLMSKIKSKPGKIIWSSGEFAGKHDGLAFYTIGERVGVKFPRPPRKRERFGQATSNFKLPTSKPIYVLDKNIRKNELVVGYGNDPLLFKKEIKVKKISWITGLSPEFPLKCEVRLRHQQPLQRCVIKTLKHESTKTKKHENIHPVRRIAASEPSNGARTLRVVFNKAQRAVTPGQFAVFYLPRRSAKGAKAGLKGECLGGGVML